jgi:hypothetical protein
MRFSPWTLSLLVVLHAGVALGDPLPERLIPQQQGSAEATTLRAVKLRELSPREEGPELPPPHERFIDRFQTAKGGFKYQDDLELGGKRYRYNLRGPVQQNKRLGLTFEIRF